MTQTTGPAHAQRSYPREVVRWGATWDEGLEGPGAAEILDASPAGIFLRPACGPTPTITRGLGIMLEFRVPGSTDKVEARGFVRWVGVSLSHGCWGVGIEFDRVCEPVKDFFGAPAKNTTEGLR